MVKLDRRVKHLCRAQKGFNNDGDEQIEHNLAADELEKDEEDDAGLTAAGKWDTSISLDRHICFIIPAFKVYLASATQIKHDHVPVFSRGASKQRQESSWESLEVRMDI